MHARSRALEIRARERAARGEGGVTEKRMETGDKAERRKQVKRSRLVSKKNVGRLINLTPGTTVQILGRNSTRGRLYWCDAAGGSRRAHCALI